MNTNQKLDNLVKDKKVLFVTGSPFQALCAVEAIREFQIEDFRIINLEYKEDGRRVQVKNILDSYKIDFEQVVLSRFTFLSFFIKSFLCKSNYDIAFVGDIYAYDYRLFALSKTKRKGQIIYLDDGNATIDVLKGVPHLRISRFPIRLYIDYILRTVKNISKERAFYTIFDDIETQQYKIYSNSLSHLDIFKLNKKQRESVGYFIGTNPDGYRELFSLSIEEYQNMVQSVLMDLRRKVDTLVYIPHGKDYNNELMAFCQSNGIQYKIMGVNIEFYLLSIPDNINLIAGFTSTALFTIKKLFPNSVVANYVVSRETSLSSETISISEYYSKHGINKIIVEV